MTGRLLDHPPTEPELSRLYFELAKRGAPSVGSESPWPYAPESPEQLVALGADMMRWDARLLSILLAFLLEHWRELDVVRLRAEMKRMRSPQALLVVGELAREATADTELRYYLDHLAAGYRRVAPAERFFLGGLPPESRTHRRRLGRSLAAYSKWGFVGTERPAADVFHKRLVGRYDASTRRAIARDLARERPGFKLAEYLDAIEHSVNRQQALTDLRAVPELHVEGHGRGARWSLGRARPHRTGGRTPRPTARRGR